MKTSTTTTELLRMTPKELRQEIALHRTEYAKMRMGVEMQKEKNHAQYKAKRREIARMNTILTAMMKNGASPAKISEEKPSQVAKKSVKGVRSKSKKAA